MNLLFANCLHFSETFQVIEHMPETTFDEIMDKCIEMNVEVCGIVCNFGKTVYFCRAEMMKVLWP